MRHQLPDANTFLRNIVSLRLATFWLLATREITLMAQPGT